MKTKLLFIILLIATISKAQIPVIDFPTAPNIGDNYTSKLDTIPEHLQNVSPGDGGENVTWDFSNSIEANGPLIIRTIVSSSVYAPLCDSFPLSNIANVGADNNPDFYTLNNQGIIFNGSIINFSGVGYVLKYDNPITNFIFPTTYNDSFVDTFHGSYPSFPNYLQINGTISSNCDGYGTLIMPNGNIYQNVLRIKYNYQITNAINTGGTVAIDTISDIYYDWVGQDITYPILAIGTRITNPANSPNDNITKYIRIKTAQNLTTNTSNAKVNSLLASPNPTNGISYINLPKSNENFQVLVHDMLGKTISKEIATPSSSFPLNLEQLENGIYFVNVSNSNFSRTIKVSKQ
ncbi:MAG: T9SS type A sorting domain-containing protein [Bacteroidota bacterium]|jgi:hypothetical protein